jgi:hypothetical protein
MEQEPGNPKFFPSGAIAFFLALITLYSVIWFFFLWLLVKRG